MQIFILYGIREYIVDEHENFLELGRESVMLATFSTEEKAVAYVEKNKTKHFKDYVSWKNTRQFKKKSLLNGYNYYQITFTEPVPHDLD